METIDAIDKGEGKQKKKKKLSFTDAVHRFLLKETRPYTTVNDLLLVGTHLLSQTRPSETLEGFPLGNFPVLRPNAIQMVPI